VFKAGASAVLYHFYYFYQFYLRKSAERNRQLGSSSANSRTAAVTRKW
jgi:hypothetical protein